jgi:hypothetical protein
MTSAPTPATTPKSNAGEGLLPEERHRRNGMSRTRCRKDLGNVLEPQAKRSGGCIRVTVLRDTASGTAGNVGAVTFDGDA